MKNEQLIETAFSDRLLRGVIHDGHVNRFIVELDGVMMYNSRDAYEAKVEFDRLKEQLQEEARDMNVRSLDDEYNQIVQHNTPGGCRNGKCSF